MAAVARHCGEGQSVPLVLLVGLVATALLGQSFQLGQEKGAADQYHADHGSFGVVESPTSAEREAEATDTIARLTGILAAVGLGQLAVIYLQLRSDARQQAWTHRPRMRVRFVESSGGPISGASWRTDIVCVNVGDSEARIHRFTSAIARRDPHTLEWIDDLNIHDPGNRAKTVTHVEPGGHINEGASLPSVLHGPDIIDIDNGRHDVFVIGLIRYEDSAGVTRRTGFLWKRSNVTGLFNPVDEHQHSYED